MIPPSSPLYTHKLEVADASFSRYPGAVKPGSPNLKLVYRRYKNVASPVSEKYNLVFVHGTGMNKGVWHSLVDKLYERCKDSGIFLNLVVALDAVNHGHSAEINKDHIGDAYDWRDTSFDILNLCEKERADFLAPNTRNIIIGHSMGGLVSLYTCFLKMDLFDACVVINPVVYLFSPTPNLSFEPFSTWRDRGYMETEFDIPEGEDWRKVVNTYMRKSSFYRAFTDTSLANLLEDEIPKEQLDKLRFSFNTTQRNTLITYFGGGAAIPPMKGALPFIRTPVYRILSEFDTATKDARAQLAEDVNGLKTVILPGQKHLVNGENPDLVVEHILRVIKDRKHAAAPEFRQYKEIPRRSRL